MLIFTENRNQFNPLMHKIPMIAAAAALLASCAPARNAFVINGNIRALPDSTEILLYSVRDDGLMQVVDTALSENGKFVLEYAPDSAQELSIVARSLGSSLLTVYAEPGKKAGISGDAGNVMLWKVRSRVPEQRERSIETHFTVRLPEGNACAATLSSNPGLHNMLNATASLAVARALGLDVNDAARALSTFEGVRRRFTHVGDVRGVTVVDDYGHHPTEITATLKAASGLGFKHVDVVFQPHRYSRLQALVDDFADAFACADRLVLIDVFSAGEMPIPGVTSKMLADVVRARHPEKEVVYVADRMSLYETLDTVAEPGDLLITMGAGDVTTVGPDYIEYVSKQEA